MKPSRRVIPHPAGLRIPWNLPAVALAVCLAAAHPARGSGDSSGQDDPPPPPGTIIAVMVADSATGLPLPGARLNVRSQQGDFILAEADPSGWVHVARSGLPSPSYTFLHWVTAGFSGYVSRMTTMKECGSAATGPCVHRFLLPRATAKNSRTFTGTVADSATLRPLPGFLVDFSHRWGGGYMNYLARTDESGRFEVNGIPLGFGPVAYIGLWEKGSVRFVEITLDRSDPILIPPWASTALAPYRTRPRDTFRENRAPVLIFRFPPRDAAGRRRD